jgi:hypothetical protein
MTKVPEKKYNLYSILEIEPDEAQQESGEEAGSQEEAVKPSRGPEKGISSGHKGRK